LPPQLQRHITASGNRFREQLAEAHGDQRATWRVANRLLHSKPPTYYSDDDCAHLSSTFSQFFIDKLKNIGDKIAANLMLNAAVAPVTRSYSRPQLDGFSPVTTADVQHLLHTILAKSSPLDVLPTSLLKL